MAMILRITGERYELNLTLGHYKEPKKNPPYFTCSSMEFGMPSIHVPGNKLGNWTFTRGCNYLKEFPNEAPEFLLKKKTAKLGYFKLRQL